LIVNLVSSTGFGRFLTFDGNIVEDVVVQGEVDAEESPRTRHPQGTFLREGLGSRDGKFASG
jgi:hypothetical protein